MNGIEAHERSCTGQPTHQHPDADNARGRRLGLRGAAGRCARLPAQVRSSKPRSCAPSALGSGEAVFGPAIARRLMQFFAGPRARDRDAHLPRADRSRARDSGADRPAARPTPRSPSALPEPEDRAQPRLEHLQQAPGRRSRPSDHPGAQGGPDRQLGTFAERACPGRGARCRADSRGRAWHLGSAKGPGSR